MEAHFGFEAKYSPLFNRVFALQLRKVFDFEEMLICQ